MNKSFRLVVVLLLIVFAGLCHLNANNSWFDGDVADVMAELEYEMRISRQPVNVHAQLYDAVLVNNVDHARDALRRGACLENHINGNSTLLHLAVFLGYLEMTQFLLEVGLNGSTVIVSETTEQAIRDVLQLAASGQLEHEEIIIDESPANHGAEEDIWEWAERMVQLGELYNRIALMFLRHFEAEDPATVEQIFALIGSEESDDESVDMNETRTNDMDHESLWRWATLMVQVGEAQNAMMLGNATRDR